MHQIKWLICICIGNDTTTLKKDRQAWSRGRVPQESVKIMAYDTFLELAFQTPMLIHQHLMTFN